MSTANRQIFATVLCGLILEVLLTQVNHYAAPTFLSLWMGGLTVAFASLRLGYREGLISVLLLGGLQDALAPVAFGLHALLFAAAHAVIFYIRNRFPREETVIGVLVALLANLGLFLVFSFTQIGASPAPGIVWGRLLVDLGFSQVALAAITPWFLALQERAVEIMGAGLRTEQRGVM
jgi:rod shape-determining protein MreD